MCQTPTKTNNVAEIYYLLPQQARKPFLQKDFFRLKITLSVNLHTFVAK